LFDGNKQVAAALFLALLDENGVLFADKGARRISPAIVALLAILAAASGRERIDDVVALVASLCPEGVENTVPSTGRSQVYEPIFLNDDLTRAPEWERRRRHRRRLLTRCASLGAVAPGFVERALREYADISNPDYVAFLESAGSFMSTLRRREIPLSLTTNKLGASCLAYAYGLTAQNPALLGADETAAAWDFEELAIAIPESRFEEACALADGEFRTHYQISGDKPSIKLVSA